MGFGTGNRCPRNRDLVLPAQDTANSRFWTAGCKLDPNRPKLGQQAPFEGKSWLKDGKKAAHTFPEWIMSMNGDSGPRWRLSQSRWVPLLAILGCFGGNFPMQCRRNTRTPGRKRTPQRIYFGSQDLPRWLQNPNGTFQIFRNVGASFSPFWC